MSLTFYKPKDITYVDMCKYIDSTIYTDDVDKEKVYEYLYLLSYMLAKQGRMFKQHKYYDDFAIFCANRLYFRVFNEKQYKFDEHGNPLLSRIKSILNYIKKTIYPMKVDFEQSEYCQNISKEMHVDSYTYNYDTILNTSLDRIGEYEFSSVLLDAPNLCKRFLQTIPRSVDDEEWSNIYLSVLLTFLNSITLPKKVKERIERMTQTRRLKDEHIDAAYEFASCNATILFHLPNSMVDYIESLVRQFKLYLKKDLLDSMTSNTAMNSVVIDYMVNDYMSGGFDNNEL